MHVGFGPQFHNLDRKLTDLEAYRRDLVLAARAEEVGFDSVWTSEHHFSDYQLTSQQLMFLAWVAGQTSRVKLGTMVTVLPWHDPVRVAESFSVLDNLSEGRAILGMGRGLGRVEFDGFRVDMAESRRRFTEYTPAILNALETGYIESDGELYRQPRIEIRPKPFKSFKGRTFASAVSPQSMELMAQLGVGIMVIAQKPWEVAEAELVEYRQRYRELNGFEAPKPILVVVTAVTKDKAEARRMREVYLQRWARSTVEHYQFDNIGFAEIEGYEYYAALAQEHREARSGEVLRLPGRPAGLGHARRGHREAGRLRQADRRRRTRGPAFVRRPAAGGDEGQLRPLRRRGAPRAEASRRRAGTSASPTTRRASSRPPSPWTDRPQTSMTVAVPMPPPAHMAATPMPPPRRRSS